MSIRAFRLSFLVIIVAYLALWGRQRDGIADDPGLGWHLRTGALVLGEARVPRTDPFLALPRSGVSSPDSPRSWVADQWLADTILQSLDSFGGWPLVYAVAIGLFTIALWGVVLSTAYVASGSALCAIVATGLAWKAAQVHLIIRPVLASIVLFAVVASRVRRLAVTPPTSKVAALRQGLVLCSLFIAWANLHPAFILGLGLVCILAAEWLPTYEWTQERSALKRYGSLFALLGACVLATFINPYGWRIYDSFLDLSSSPYLRSINQEWRPLHIGSNEGVLVVLVSVVPLALTLATKPRRASGSLFDIFSTALFTYAAFRMVRFVPYAVIVGAPFAASAIARLREVRLPPVCGVSGRFIAALERRLTLPRSPTLLAAVIALVGGALVVCGVTPFSEGQMGPSEALYPPQMFDAIGRDARSGVILASPDYGGAITWRLHPGFRPVLDDRNNLVGEGLYRRYFRATEDQTELDGLIREYGVTHLIVGNESPVVRQLSEERNWMILYQDSARRVYRVPSS
ncbi:MAG: hypothetical protein RL326_2279 [Pseudomonadota bacterium]|jgi:hypothetical protein